MAFNASISRRSSYNFPSRKGSESGQPTSWHVEGIIGDPQIRQANEAYARMLPATSFLKWRPTYHLMASHAWMNGPCAPGFDPETGLYHLSFQWNPRNNRWGHISWGHATSKDLINWEISSSPSLEPEAPYDQKGIFTGCMRATGLDGNPGTLTVFYTSVNRLPIHYTLPYHRGSETLSTAKSEDGGKTWLKSSLNPILVGPPPDLDICSWRDPFVTPWPSLDRLMSRSTTGNLYGLLSGGIRNQTPAIFLYSIHTKSLSEWNYLCPLITIGLDHQLSRWAGNKGKNWDAANLLTLSDVTGSQLDFIITGVEGSSRSSEPNSPSHAHQVQRTPHSQQWLSGTLCSSFRPETNATEIHLKHRFGGTFDHGCLYAANSFLNPPSNTFILWGWITEQDLPQTFVDAQNWSGLLSLPREIHLLRYERVKSALLTPLNEITCFYVEPDVGSTYIVRTLGIVPAKALEGLRSNARSVALETPRNLNGKGGGNQGSSLDVQTARWELLCEMKIGERCGSVGFVISHTPDNSITTTLTFTPQNETLTLARPSAAAFSPRINTRPEIAPHTLLSFQSQSPTDPSSTTREQEILRIRAFFDESVLEIFVNDRTVISTRIFTPTKRCFGIVFFAEMEAEVGVTAEEQDIDAEMTGTGNDKDTAVKRSVQVNATDINDSRESTSREEQRENGDGNDRAAEPVAQLLLAQAWDGLRADMRIVGTN